jgi:type III secretion protein T
VTALGFNLESILVLALGLTRSACAFALLPVLTNQVAPALVRNSLFVGMGLIVLTLQPAQAFAYLTAPGWIAAFVREAFIGLTVGFFFAGVLWALQIAGDFIDHKANTARFSLADPFSGGSGAVYGGFFSRLAVFAFAASGGLLYMTTIILQSYALWPIGGQGPNLHPQDVTVFERVFGNLIALALMFSAPALVLNTVLDAALGLLNRFSPQFNVMSLSLGLKMWFSVFAVAVTAAILADLMAGDVFAQGARAIDFIGR